MVLLDQGSRTVALGVLAGVIAGGILAGINVVVVRPFIDALSNQWINQLIDNGVNDEDVFNQQLQSIYTSSLVLPLAIGLGSGALFGLVYRSVSLKERQNRPLTPILIAAVLWFVLSVIPSLKYPPEPLVTFNPDSIPTYPALIVAYTAISGAAALGCVLLFRRSSRKTKWFGAAAMYLTVMSVTSFMFPAPITSDLAFSQPLIAAWRSAISLGSLAFWFSLGVIAGQLWKHGTGERIIHQV